MLVWLKKKYEEGGLTEQAAHFLKQKFLTCGDDLKQLPGFLDVFELWLDENAWDLSRRMEGLGPLNIP